MTSNSPNMTGLQRFHAELASGEREWPKRKMPSGSSLMKVIKRKCQECMGFQLKDNPGSGAGSTMIAECTAKSCLLFNYRPFQEERK